MVQPSLYIQKTEAQGKESTGQVSTKSSGRDQIKKRSGNFPLREWGVQWLRLHASNAGAVGLIPGWETKIPHVMQQMNVCRPYPLLEVPVNIFRHVLDITIGHVNNSTFFFLFPLPFANLECFLFLSRRKRPTLSCLKPLGLLPVAMHSLRNVNKLLGCGESDCQCLSSVLQLK